MLVRDKVGVYAKPGGTAGVSGSCPCNTGARAFFVVPPQKNHRPADERRKI